VHGGTFTLSLNEARAWVKSTQIACSTIVSAMSSRLYAETALRVHHSLSQGTEFWGVDSWGAVKNIESSLFYKMASQGPTVLDGFTPLRNETVSIIPQFILDGKDKNKEKHSSNTHMSTFCLGLHKIPR
jgi:hypothetical protein